MSLAEKLAIGGAIAGVLAVLVFLLAAWERASTLWDSIRRWASTRFGC